jgi:hypothetical protein
LGGTKKEKARFANRTLLQWEAIKISYLEKCVGYNISLGWILKVLKILQNNFVSQQYINEDTKFYVLNKKIFNFSCFSLRKIKPQKKVKLLTVLKGKS